MTRWLTDHLEFRLNVVGLFNAVLIALVAAWAYFGGINETLQDNKREIMRVSNTQKQVVETQAKVVEAVTDIKTLLAAMREKDDGITLRLNRAENMLDAMRGNPRIGP